MPQAVGGGAAPLAANGWRTSANLQASSSASREGL